MYKIINSFFKGAGFMVFLVAISFVSCRRPIPAPPVAREIPSRIVIHNETLMDPYKWMENSKDTSVLNYLRAEDDYAQAYLKRVDDLQNKIYNEFVERNNLKSNQEIIRSGENSCSTPDGKYIIYVDDHNSVLIHLQGSSSTTDSLIYSEKDKGAVVMVALSASKKFIFIVIETLDMSETRFLPGDLHNLKPIIIQPRERGHRYHVDHYGSDYFWIQTNQNAPNGRLVQGKVAHPGSKFWITTIVYHDSTFLQGFALVNQKYLVLLERKSLKASVRIVDLSSKTREEMNRITFSEPDGGLKSDGYDSIEGKLLIRYSSMLTPPTQYIYNLSSRRLGIRWQTKIKNYNKDDYGSRLLWAKSKDGTVIPLTVLYKKDFDKQDGTNPLLLTTFGCYGLTDTVKFHTSFISLLDRGFYVVFAHIRGGGELGQVWWEEGRGLKKKNAFNDFLDCAEFLISRKYTSKGLITALGKEAGGLIIGVAVNERPDLFKAILFQSPLMDPLSLTLDSAGNRLYANDRLEFGNPCEKLYYDNILSYSPYENIRKQDYPPMFFCSAETKGNYCDYESIKSVARLRKNKTGDNILIFRIGMNESPPENRYKSLAEQWAFILNLYDIKQ